MYYKKYIMFAVFVAFSGSILAWFFFYSDFLHPLPIRAKQVLYLENDLRKDSLRIQRDSI